MIIVDIHGDPGHFIFLQDSYSTIAGSSMMLTLFLETIYLGSLPENFVTYEAFMLALPGCFVNC